MISFGSENSLSLYVRSSTAEMRGYLFNIHILSVSVKNYPYPLRSDIVNCYTYSIRISSIDRKTKKLAPDIFGCSCNTGCPILIPSPHVVFGTKVDVAYFLIFATTTKKAKVIYLSQIAQKRK